VGCSFEDGNYSGYPVIFFRGELDLAVCPEFDERMAAISQGDNQCVILDLLEVPYTEAKPLRAVLAAYRAMTAKGRVLVVVCCAPMVDKLIQLSGIDDHVPLFHSLEAAAAHLSQVC